MLRAAAATVAERPLRLRRDRMLTSAREAHANDADATADRSASPPRNPAEWKVINGRLLHKPLHKAHERSVSARHDADGHGILPRFTNQQPFSPTARRKLEMAEREQPFLLPLAGSPRHGTHHVADYVAASRATRSLPPSPRVPKADVGDHQMDLLVAHFPAWHAGSESSRSPCRAESLSVQGVED